MTRTNLYLIRHGEAVVNRQPIVGGMKGDTGLTKYGIQQAEALRDRLAGTREIIPDVFIASTLPRARQTAEIIAPAFDRELLFDAEFQELRVGEADGMLNRDAWAKYGLPNVEQDAFHRIAPGGENWAEFTLRVGTNLSRVTREHAGKTIVIVCHGGVIDASFLYFFDMGTLNPPRRHLHTINTSLTHWRGQCDDDERTIWRLMKYNDTAHLRHVGARDSINWRDTSLPTNDDDHPGVPLPMEQQPSHD